jgi:hypothetical protein
MAKLGAVVEKVRSKNAGPFWLTIDIFCGTDSAFEQTCKSLTNLQVAAVFAITPKTLKRFEIPSLNVVKFSLPRPEIQGSVKDRDMHGASWAALLSDVELSQRRR